jgi:hypothetical protein
MSSDIERLWTLTQLEDYAVQNGYSIPEKLIADMAEMDHKYLREVEPVAFDARTLGAMDQVAIELSQITYPVTLTNVARLQGRVGVPAFVYILLSVGLAAAFMSGFLAWIIKENFPYAGLAKAALPLLLGVVGAVVYVMMPNGKLNTVAGLDAENIADSIVRVAMGGLLGFVLYAVYSITKSGSTPPNGSTAIDNWTLFLPLVGGYSATLVVGILAKAVAVQLTLNIDEKSIRASLHK